MKNSDIGLFAGLASIFGLGSPSRISRKTGGVTSTLSPKQRAKRKARSKIAKASRKKNRKVKKSKKSTKALMARSQSEKSKAKREARELAVIEAKNRRW